MRKIFYIFVMMLSLAACERVSPDIDPNTTTNPTNNSDNSQSVFYTWQGNDIAVDALAFGKAGAIKTINIAKNPIYGTAVFTDNFINYHPFENVVEANDQLELEIVNKNGASVTQTVYFKIKSKDSDIPCHTGALPDRFEIEKGKNATLDVIGNDKFCNSAYIGNTLILRANPKNGTATVANDKITYTPNTAFISGEDSFIYEISAKDNAGNTLKRNALVKINIKDIASGCKLKLIGDYIIVPENLPIESIVIKPLDNDNLCLGTGVLSIEKNPDFGTVKVNSDNTTLTYTFPKGNPGFPPMSDVMKYKYCESGNCGTAVIIVDKKDTLKINNDCKVMLQSDEYIVSLKKIMNIPNPILFINIVDNDFVCDKKNLGSLEIKNIVPSTANIANNKSGFIKVLPSSTTNKFEKGEITFEYEIKDGKTQKVLTAQVKIKFVD